eukprot:3002329-Alexandrium_andersonii.AAC.1
MAKPLIKMHEEDGDHAEPMEWMCVKARNLYNMGTGRLIFPDSGPLRVHLQEREGPNDPPPRPPAAFDSRD